MDADDADDDVEAADGVTGWETAGDTDDDDGDEAGIAVKEGVDTEGVETEVGEDNGTEDEGVVGVPIGREEGVDTEREGWGVVGCGRGSSRRYREEMANCRMAGLSTGSEMSWLMIQRMLGSLRGREREEWVSDKYE